MQKIFWFLILPLCIILFYCGFQSFEAERSWLDEVKKEQDEAKNRFSKMLLLRSNLSDVDRFIAEKTSIRLTIDETLQCMIDFFHKQTRGYKIYYQIGEVDHPHMVIASYDPPYEKMDEYTLRLILNISKGYKFYIRTNKNFVDPPRSKLTTFNDEWYTYNISFRSYISGNEANGLAEKTLRVISIIFGHDFQQVEQNFDSFMEEQLEGRIKALEEENKNLFEEKKQIEKELKQLNDYIQRGNSSKLFELQAKAQIAKKQAHMFCFTAFFIFIGVLLFFMNTLRAHN